MAGHGFWKMIVAEKITLITKMMKDGEVMGNEDGATEQEAQDVWHAPQAPISKGTGAPAGRFLKR
jgi:hypothetical protein